MTAGAQKIAQPCTDLPMHAAYRPDIDGLRAVAVISVVVYHAAPGRMQGGFVGVDIFFVISGFLITGIIVSGLERDRFSFANFYARRIRRIFPALTLVLFTCLATGVLLFTPEELAALGKHVLAGAAFVSNLTLWSEAGYFDSSGVFKPLLHLWSLGVEEQYYLVWPALLYASHRLGRHRWTMFAMVATLAVASFAWSVQQSTAAPVAAYFSPLTRFWELFIGALLALAVRHPTFHVSRPVRNLLSWLGCSLVIAAFTLIDDSKPFPGLWAGLPTLGAAALVLAGPDAWFNRRLLARAPMVWLGLISYPLYLWHWPLIVVPRILVGGETAQWIRLIAIIAAVLLAWATYRLVEMPVRRGNVGRRVTMVLSALIGFVGLAGAVAWVGRGLPARPWAPAVVNVGEIGAPPYFQYIAEHFYPCTPIDIRRSAMAGEQYLRCPQSRPYSDQDLVIIGDSHAETLFPGLAEAMPDRNIVFYGIGEGLPFLSNPDYARVFDYVTTSKSVDTVIIAAVWPRKLKPLAVAGWRSDLTSTVARLRAAGKTVYLADDVPNFSFLPSRCKFGGRLGMPAVCQEKDVNYEAIYTPVFDDIARKTGAHRLHIHQLFCSKGSCSMALDHVLLFRDEHHLGIAGSRRAGAAIVRTMKVSVDSFADQQETE